MTILCVFFFPFIYLFILRQSLPLSPRLECSGTITACCSFFHFGSGNPRTSSSQVGGTCSRHASPHLAVLSSLVSNSWIWQSPGLGIILLPQLPKVLGLQVWARCMARPQIYKPTPFICNPNLPLLKQICTHHKNCCKHLIFSPKVLQIKTFLFFYMCKFVI